MAGDIRAKIALDGEQNFKAAIKSINAELKTMQSEIKYLDTDMKANGTSVEGLTRKQDALRKAQEASLSLEKQLDVAIKSATDKYNKAKDATIKYRDELEKAKRSGTASAEEIAKLEKAVSDSERAERNALNTLNGYENQLNKAKTTTTQLNAQLSQNEAALRAIKDPYEKAGDAAEGFADGNEKAGDAVEAMADVLAAAGVNEAVDKIRDALLECADAANVYETSIAKVSTLTGNADISQISEGILEMSGRLGVSANEIADSMYQALSASVDTADALKFVEQSTKLAIGGFTDASTAVDVLTTIINAYGLKASDAARISDVLVNTQNAGKTTVAELGASLGQVIPIAATYNVSLENLAAAYVGMTKSGINTANATTYIRSALNELGDSGSKVSEILMDLTGKNFAQLSASGYSLGDVLELLAGTVEHDSTAFANLWGNVRAGLGAMSIVNAGTDEYNATINLMNTNLGVADENFQKIANTSERAGQRLSNSLENLKIAVGQELQKPLDAVKEKLTGVVESLTEWVKEHPWVVKVISGLVVSLTIAAGVMTAYTIATKLAEKATAAFSAAVAGTMSGKIVIAVSAVIAAITALVTIFGGLKSESEQLLDETEALAKSHADASEEYARTAGEYKTAMKSAETQTDRATKAEEGYAAALERRKQVLAENQQAEDALAEATSRGEEVNDAYKKQIEEITAAGGDAYAVIMMQRQAEEDYAKAIENANEVLSENEKELQQAQTDANYFYLAMTELDDKSREAVDTFLAEAETLGTTSEAYSNVIGQVAAMTEAHGELTAAIQNDIDGINAEIENLQTSYDDAYNAAYNSLSGQFGLFDEVSVKTAQSVGDMIANLQTQAAFMEQYSANLEQAIQLGLSDSLVKALSDGSAESAAILQSIVDDGGANIDALNTQFEKVAEGKEAFAGELANIQTDFDETMAGLETRLSQAVGRMNQANAAYASAVNTIQGNINGAESMRGRLVAEYISLARAATNAYNSELQQHSPSKVFEKSGENTVEGAIVGTQKKAPELLKTYTALGAGVADRYSNSVSTMPSLATFSPNNNVQVAVHIGDRELTNMMYSGIVRKIETTNRNASAMAGRR